MEFEFVANPGFNFLTSFGEQFGIPVQGDTLSIPATMGKGYVRKIDLDPEFKLLIHHYTLNEQFVLKRLPADKAYDLVSVIFHSNEEVADLSTPDREKPVRLARGTQFAIQIASPDLESIVHFPAGTAVNFIVVGITAVRLKSLLGIQKPNSVIQTILSGAPGFLFYESMGPDVHKTVRQLTDGRQERELSALYYSIKVQELMLLVFDQLLKRDTVRHSPIYKDDIDKLFVVRTAVLADLGQPPHLAQLAKLVGMSETKLKDLFRQVFGDSIYTHYQKARMEEAAFLLKQGGHSVTDVGNQLGFSNLSHFSRLFEKHYGVKPKKYASGG
ncbi:AraC family transcriptional regulator [Spirosoma sp. KUDC1026]|uniref:AraC family transcriptional regulator n=1 Tax=Spirosoma sp. KUDC1026 TaxID=2745947 RepID=UPI00159B9436|nr:AraC family transcriptional regulator [Spirosoma sp. KUDC1026]QKZ13748.1 helix-turn-helix transcriptional regulator [Spirosoma sp. KUDC1026]